jgi:hypothetical protein
MSSSVMVARTRIWRTIVAIIRSGNFSVSHLRGPQPGKQTKEEEEEEEDVVHN